MAGLSPGFDPRPVSVRFVTDTVASGQIFLRVFLFSPVRGEVKAGEVCEVKAENTVNCALRLIAVLKQTPPQTS